jgi:hypothetical protein
VALELIRTGQTATLNREAVRAAVARVEAALLELGQQAAAILQQMQPAVERLIAVFGEFAPHRQEGPADPMERALWLRQHRNTGPSRGRGRRAGSSRAVRSEPVSLSGLVRDLLPEALHGGDHVRVFLRVAPDCEFERYAPGGAGPRWRYSVTDVDWSGLRRFGGRGSGRCG